MPGCNLLRQAFLRNGAVRQTILASTSSLATVTSRPPEATASRLLPTTASNRPTLTTARRLPPDLATRRPVTVSSPRGPATVRLLLPNFPAGHQLDHLCHRRVARVAWRDSHADTVDQHEQR